MVIFRDRETKLMVIYSLLEGTNKLHFKIQIHPKGIDYVFSILKTKVYKNTLKSYQLNAIVDSYFLFD